MCEGLWRQSNATLSYIPPSGVVVRDAMTYVNGVGLGDTPSHALRSSDTLVIAVNTSRKLVFVHALTGALLGSTPTPGAKEPYRLARSGRRVWCTNLNDDTITEFDLPTMQVVVPSVSVGPAPDGIGAVDGKVYVALSGLGDLRKSEPGAGSIVVLREFDLQEIGHIDSVPNAGAIAVDPVRHAVWCCYRNLASKPNEAGGVVLVNAQADTIVRRWEFTAPTNIAIHPQTGDVFVLHAHGIHRIAADGTSSVVATHEATTTGETWYSIAYAAASRTLYVGNARSFLTDGEVLTLNESGEVLERYSVGPNPSCIIPP